MKHIVFKYAIKEKPFYESHLCSVREKENFVCVHTSWKCLYGIDLTSVGFVQNVGTTATFLFGWPFRRRNTKNVVNVDMFNRKNFGNRMIDCIIPALDII